MATSHQPSDNAFFREEFYLGIAIKAFDSALFKCVLSSWRDSTLLFYSLNKPTSFPTPSMLTALASYRSLVKKDGKHAWISS
jgi:hypothetical protein